MTGSTHPNNVKVSICVIAYNHELFIAQAIESVLMQKADFIYEIIVGEDCSTDCTRRIVEDYRKKYPETITVITSDYNVGGSENFIRVLKACKGEYIAYLDGDDYWTDDKKLQKQVDFLDRDKMKRFIGCFHNVYSLHLDGSMNKNNKYMSNHVKTQRGLLFGHIPHLSATMFRNNLNENTFHILKTHGALDWLLHILNAEYGDYGYIDEAMSVYRININGAYTSLSLQKRGIDNISWMEKINSILHYRYNKEYRKRIARIAYRVADISENLSDWRIMRRYVVKAFLACPGYTRISLRHIVKSFVLAFIPCSRMVRQKRSAKT
jgi:glycosyltransferase involved in cell wall biosynthesis